MRSSYPIFTLLLSAAICGLFLFACGNTDGESQDSDSEETETDTEVPDDGDEDGDSESVSGGCVLTGCTEGLVCDTSDGICRGCERDAECGSAEDEAALARVCQLGRCQDVACPSLRTEPNAIAPVDLTPQPLSATLLADGAIHADDRNFLVRGLSGLNRALFTEAAGNGVNFIMSETSCCALGEADYQLSSLLPGAYYADLFMGLTAIWPPESLPEILTGAVIDAFADRSAMPAFALWMGGDWSTETAIDTAFAARLREVLRDDLRIPSPIAHIVSPAQDASVLSESADLFIIDILDETPLGIYQLLQSASSTAPSAPLWIRLPAEKANHLKLIAALAAGVRGFLFRFPDESDAAPASRDTIWPLIAYLGHEESRFLNAAAVSDLPPGVVGLINRDLDKKTIYLVANLSESAAEVTLASGFESEAYCLAQSGHGAMTLSSGAHFSFTIEPGAVIEWQVAEFHAIDETR